MNEESRKVIDKLKSLRPGLMRENSITRLRIYGSVGRGEASSDSDVDLIVDFEKKPSLLGVVNIQNQIQDILGRKVDMMIEDELHPALKDKILEEARDV